MMDRLSLLTRYVEQHRTRAFRAGQHDCALFAAGWVRLITGRDLARGWRSRYRSLAQGKRLLMAQGFDDHLALAAHHLPEVAPVFAEPGDLVVLGDGALGILAGDIAYCLRPTGLGLQPRSEARRAFAVRFP